MMSAASLCLEFFCEVLDQTKSILVMAGLTKSLPLLSVNITPVFR